MVRLKTIEAIGRLLSGVVRTLTKYGVWMAPEKQGGPQGEMSGKEINGRESIVFDSSIIPDYDGTIKDFDDGDIVSGEVVRIDKDEVLVDVGYKSEGAIPLRELSIRSDVDPHEIVKIGDKIEALVLQKEDKDGRLILSKKRAEYEKAWVDIERIANEGALVEGEVIEVVKGGLILNIGLRGFLPASLVDLRRVKDLYQYVGCKLECKIIEMDRNRNNVVLSRRAVLEEERKHERQKVLSTISKGKILSGKVSSIVDFGAFVDLGGIDGLVHISELSWEHVEHPSEVVKVGDEVNVLVLDVNAERGRISLGLKQTQENPWKELVSDLSIGQIVEGPVTKMTSFGAFVQLREGVEGLVHVSEISDRHVEVPEHVLNVGDIVTAKIVGIDVDRRRVALSMKQVCEPERGEEAQDQPPVEGEGAPTEDQPPFQGSEEPIDARAPVEGEGAEAELQPEPLTEEAVEEEAADEVAAEVAAADVVAEAVLQKAPRRGRPKKAREAGEGGAAAAEVPDSVKEAGEPESPIEEPESQIEEPESPFMPCDDDVGESAGESDVDCGDADSNAITAPATLEEALADMKANKA